MPQHPSPRPSPVALHVATEKGPAPRLRTDTALTRVRHGVYANAVACAALAPWQRYLARVHAVALIRPDSVFCLESSAALLGLPFVGEPRDVHVFDADSPTSHRQGDIVLHTSRDARSVISLGGISLTSSADTVIDLMRVLPPGFALGVADAAISPRQRGAHTIAELATLASAQVARRGRRTLEWAWIRADSRSESFGESVSRAVIEWLGFPPPTLQQVFHFEGVEDRCDFFWPEHSAIGESDGYGKYDGADVEQSRQRLIAEKVREDRLRRHIGGFARWDWSDALRATPLQHKLLTAGVPRVSASQPAMLSTLRAKPR